MSPTVKVRVPDSQTSDPGAAYLMAVHLWEEWLMRVPAKVVTLALRLRRRVSDSLPTTNPSGRAHGTHFLIDRQGIALVIVVAVLALVLTISALWIALRPI